MNDFKWILFLSLAILTSLLIEFGPVAVAYYHDPSRFVVIKSDGLIKGIPLGIDYRW